MAASAGVASRTAQHTNWKYAPHSEIEGRMICCRDRRRRSPNFQGSRNKPPPAPLPEKPELYGVYKGRVSNVLEFGCFVELQGFRKKAEGLVHTSNISKLR